MSTLLFAILTTLPLYLSGGVVFSVWGPAADLVRLHGILSARVGDPAWLIVAHRVAAIFGVVTMWPMAVPSADRYFRENEWASPLLKTNAGRTTFLHRRR